MSDDTARIIRHKTPPESASQPSPPMALGFVPPGRTGPIFVEEPEPTRIYHSPQGVDAPSPEQVLATAFGPVAGWLIILDGPGRGNSLTIGYGMNHVGTSASNRVVLDFGDEDISRRNHATITYRPANRTFEIQPGADPSSQVWLGSSVVMRKTELRGGEVILLGQTTLKFIALCGPDFSWE